MSLRVITGDALTELAKLPTESVHCCVTSPPYYGLRDYGTATWDGGDPACDHKYGTARQDGGRTQTDGFHGSAAADSDKGAMNYRGICPCGAHRIDAQLGLEATPDEYVAAMVGVFREVRRVLRSDGTLWLNIGDSYASGMVGERGEKQRSNAGALLGPKIAPIGYKPKDLLGIPWLLAFALRADGWYLRQDIIWAKPNPMPESVTDRCTKAHEYLFLLSKSERYYFDAAAIREEAEYGYSVKPGMFDRIGDLHRPPSRTTVGSGPDGTGGFRNKRSVWTIATAPYSEAHFATFPPALVQPCILAGCPKGGTVLDPFLGAGTTALVADRLGRDAIGIELNPTYAAMAQRRIHDDCPLFFEAAE